MKLLKNKDIFGREIKAGDWIVYGAAKGRCAGLNFGRVIDSGLHKPDYGKPFVRTRAWTVNVSWGELRVNGTSGYRPEKKPRPSLLCFTDRICVVPADMIPDSVKALLPA